MFRSAPIAIVVLSMLVMSACEVRASGKKKTQPKKSEHDHLHIEDLEAADNPREFIEGKHDVEGYLIIGWWYKGRDLEQAFSIINEGIKHNPKAFQLHYQLAQLFLSRARTETENIVVPNEFASATLTTARKHYKTAAELGVKMRNASKVTEWGKTKEVDLRGAARMTILMERRYGDHLEADRLEKQFSDVLAEDESQHKHDHAH